MSKLLSTLLLAGLLAGCASTTSTAPPAAPSTPAQRTARSPRPWRSSGSGWARGSATRRCGSAQRGDGAVSVEVPREFSFEPGKSSVKPALAAVLDKVAESLRRVPQAQVALLAAPDDAEVATPLATQRAERMRDHLRSRGIAESRLGRPSPAAIGVGAAAPDRARRRRPRTPAPRPRSSLQALDLPAAPPGAGRRVV